MTELFPRLYSAVVIICPWLTSWDCSPKLFSLSIDDLSNFICRTSHTSYKSVQWTVHLWNLLTTLLQHSVKKARFCFIMSTYCISYSFAFPTLHLYFIRFWKHYNNLSNRTEINKIYTINYSCDEHCLVVFLHSNLPNICS